MHLPLEFTGLEKLSSSLELLVLCLSSALTLSLSIYLPLEFTGLEKLSSSLELLVLCLSSALTLPLSVRRTSPPP
jgi:hypothetical protein